MSSTLSPPETTPPGLAEFAAGVSSRRGPRDPRKPSPPPPAHPPVDPPAYGAVAAPAEPEPAAAPAPARTGGRSARTLPADARSVMIGVRVRDQVDQHLLRVLTDLRLDHGVETTRTELVEMLLWEDAQATPAFATRLQRFRQAHPAVRRRV
jgi:hypothetical protein